MPTPVFVCGAECGIAAIGTLSPGLEHWSGITSTPSVVTSGPATMRSTRAFRFNPTAATIGLEHTFATAIASPATMVGRCYIYFTTLPDADVGFIIETAVGRGVYFKQSDSKIYAGSDLGSYGATGVAVTTGQWYRIDFKIVRDTTTTIDVQVDGVACGQRSLASTAGTIAIVRFGNGLTSCTADYYIDDAIVSGTSADYPIGEGTIVGLYPNGDLTNSAATPTDGNSGHFYSAVTDFGKGSGGGTNLGAQNAEATSWQSLANPLLTTVATNFLANKTGASTEHLVHTYADMPAGVASVNGLACVSTHHAAAATANTQRLLVRRGTTADFYPIVNASTFSDLSDTTIIVCYRCKATDSTAAAWTESTVNSLQTVWDSDDVAPDAYLDGVMFEVDYVPAETGLPHVSPYRQLLAHQ